MVIQIALVIDMNRQMPNTAIIIVITDQRVTFFLAEIALQFTRMRGKSLLY